MINRQKNSSKLPIHLAVLLQVGKKNPKKPRNLDMLLFCPKKNPAAIFKMQT